MKIKSLSIVLLAVYVAILVPFSAYMKNRPIAVKLGYLPEAQVLKLACADYRNLLAHGVVLKGLFYFGTLVDKFKNRVQVQPETFNLFKTMQTAVRLDPYNMDAYYFTQAAFTWELGRIREVNDMLSYGMEYRTWDYQLPFFIGFNAAYFQKDFMTAAMYMKKAAELSGDPLFTTLAARYFYEAGQNDLGLLFIGAMEKGAKDKKVKRLYQLRKEALLGVKKIQDAVSRYQQKFGRFPAAVNELVTLGYLDKIPIDPYGGTFYLDKDGMVRSSSKFAFTESPPQVKPD